MYIHVHVYTCIIYSHKLSFMNYDTCNLLAIAKKLPKLPRFTIFDIIIFFTNQQEYKTKCFGSYTATFIRGTKVQVAV